MSWLDPKFWLALLIGAALCVGGGYGWGHHAASTACAAQDGKDTAATVTAQNTRDTHIDAIGADASQAAAQAHNDTQGAGDERAARIRTVYVPADCRTVPAGIVLELDTARDRINAKIGGGVRPGPADPGTAAAAH